MNFNPSLFLDFYKTAHHLQFPDGTTSILSNFTARGSRIPAIDKTVFFGLQYYILEYLVKQWNDNFFSVPTEEAVKEYQDIISDGLGPDAPAPDHIRALHKLGYLPIEIKAVPEGTMLPLRVAGYTIRNTKPEFYWLTNFLETQMSATIWPMCTSATIAARYRKVFNEYAKETGSPLDFCAWQGHDFSMRGMFGIEAAMMSGAAHLLSFTGTDTVPAIAFLRRYYDGKHSGFIGGSVAATEHAVACANGTNEKQTLVRLLTKVHPRGILSYVSDTWDFWKIITEVLPSIKNIIMFRKGKLVIRPDSGDPVKILVGDSNAQTDHERQGLVDVLYSIFDGSVNSSGYRVLDPHIGSIYGDSITLERQDQILAGLKAKGYASCNVVLGIGSYTYQYVTRDTFGYAIKATHAIIDNESKDLYKAPKTDSGIKKSAKGRILVKADVNGNITQEDQVSEEVFNSPANLLQVVYKDGAVGVLQSLKSIRERLAKNNK